jgi:hypothetical protein
METLMASSRNTNLRSLVVRALLAVALVTPVLFLSGCMMTPEDKAFYGRGWINPDELDQDDQAPPSAYADPTTIQPHMLGPGEY